MKIRCCVGSRIQTNYQSEGTEGSVRSVRLSRSVCRALRSFSCQANERPAHRWGGSATNSHRPRRRRSCQTKHTVPFSFHRLSLNHLTLFVCRARPPATTTTTTTTTTLCLPHSPPARSTPLPTWLFCFPHRISTASPLSLPHTHSTKRKKGFPSIYNRHKHSLTATFYSNFGKHTQQKKA